MPEPAIELLPYQKAAIESPARFTWNCWARQTGKSFTFSLRRILRGLERRRNQVFLSAGERQSRELMQKVRMHCSVLKIWSELRGESFWQGSSVRRLEARLPGGVRIIALPANPATARGFSGDVFLDEFAMHRDDKAIWAALFPTLLRGEGELDIASTPRGRKNVFHRLGQNTAFEQRTVTLEDAIASGLDVDAPAMRAAIDDEIAWRQEFCCEFVDEATSFITLDLIQRCQDARLTTAVDWDRLADRFAEVYIGVDVGRFRDVTAAWIWERRAGAAVQSGVTSQPRTEGVMGGTAFVDAATTGATRASAASASAARTSGASASAPRPSDLFVTRGVVVLANSSFSDQEEMVAALMDQPAVRRCCIDATGLGLQLAERLTERFGEHRVEGVTFTAALKSQLAGTVRVLAERDALRIPIESRITDDWHSLSRIVTPSGHVRFDADRSSGGHGDRFWAAALGLHAVEGVSGGRGGGLVSSGPLAFARAGIW